MFNRYPQQYSKIRSNQVAPTPPASPALPQPSTPPSHQLVEPSKQRFQFEKMINLYLNMPQGSSEEGKTNFAKFVSICNIEALKREIPYKSCLGRINALAVQMSGISTLIDRVLEAIRSLNQIKESKDKQLIADKFIVICEREDELSKRIIKAKELESNILVAIKMDSHVSHYETDRDDFKDIQKLLGTIAEFNIGLDNQAEKEYIEICKRISEVLEIIEHAEPSHNDLINKLNVQISNLKVCQQAVEIIISNFDFLRKIKEKVVNDNSIRFQDQVIRDNVRPMQSNHPMFNNNFSQNRSTELEEKSSSDCFCM